MRRPLRIAQIAPLYESVPPKLYGGTERVVAWLSEELVRRGHQVTLFAAGDSKVEAPLHAGFPNALRLSGLERLGPAYHMPMLTDVLDQARHFDIIHSHLELLSFPFAHFAPVPMLFTIHGRVDQPDLAPVYQRYKDLPLISISNSQRDSLPTMNWVANIYHGLPHTEFQFNPTGGNYLAFLGRLSPEKRPELAIEVARRAGIPIKIAAKIDRNNEVYFDTVIKPLLSLPGVEYVGEISQSQKQEFLGNALALILPIDWPEPFGLVMIEALACGTPVIARPFGSVPELLRNDLSGIIAADVDGLVEAVKRVAQISRSACRAQFEARFTADIMTANYENLYYRMLEGARPAFVGNGRSAPDIKRQPLVAEAGDGPQAQILEGLTDRSPARAVEMPHSQVK
jgi:glycosyltransferase involved in cell wall biosynthesis